MYRGKWTASHAVPVPVVRSYELSLTRARPRAAPSDSADASPLLAESCNKDPRKGAVESGSSGRKTAGVLAAVSPCLQILAIRPMFASESMTQIDLLAVDLLSLFPWLSYILYDNACGIRRHLRRQVADRADESARRSSWQQLLNVNWVVDRLHWTYHRACRDPQHAHYDPGVSPHAHKALMGVDTEAAEQVFHIASRWQVILSTTAPIHQEMFLLIFASEHNLVHSCCFAEAQLASRRQRVAMDEEVAPIPAALETDAAVSDCGLQVPVQRRRRRAAPGVPACGIALPQPAAASVLSLQGAGSAIADAAHPAPSSAVPEQTAAAKRQLLLGEYCVVNMRSMKAHSLTCPSSGTTVCGWWFGPQAECCRSIGLLMPGLSYCGTCCGSSAPVDL